MLPRHLLRNQRSRGSGRAARGHGERVELATSVASAPTPSGSTSPPLAPTARWRDQARVEARLGDRRGRPAGEPCASDVAGAPTVASTSPSSPAVTHAAPSLPPQASGSERGDSDGGERLGRRDTTARRRRHALRGRDGQHVREHARRNPPTGTTGTSGAPGRRPPPLAATRTPPAARGRSPGRRLGLVQIQRDGVDAETLAGRARPVGEHVAQVAAAAPAGHLGAGHAVAVVVVQLDRARPRRAR